jgi:hypothetical protein
MPEEAKPEATEHGLVPGDDGPLPARCRDEELA